MGKTDIIPRNKSAEAIFECLTVKHRLGFYIDIPGAGTIRLRGQSLLEFLVILRSQQYLAFLDQWVDAQKGMLSDLSPAKRPCVQNQNNV